MDMDLLIKKYRSTLKSVRDAQVLANDADRKLLADMVSDLEYAIEWMRTARQPGLRRGADRRSAYQREILTDNPLKYQKYYLATVVGQVGSISEEDREQIDEALKCLTKLEREVYLMARGQCISRSQIASNLGVCKGTVNNVLTRAEKKLLKYRTSCRPFATYI